MKSTTIIFITLIISFLVIGLVYAGNEVIKKNGKNKIKKITKITANGTSTNIIEHNETEPLTINDLKEMQDESIKQKGKSDNYYFKKTN